MKARSITTLLLLLAMALGAVAQTPEKDKSKTTADSGKTSAKAKSKEKGKGKAADANVETSGGFEVIGSMIPEGMKNYKVRVPGFEHGRNTSLLIAKTMTRVKPQELFAEELTIDLYEEEEKDNVQVDMRTGTYHMDTKLLTSDQRSKVTRSDFTLEGDTMVFDTSTSKGKMTGRVHMVIYSTGSQKEPSGETQAPAATDGKTPATPAPELAPNPNANSGTAPVPAAPDAGAATAAAAKAPAEPTPK